MRHRTRTTREKSPWAVFSVLIAIIVFGMFWLWQKQQITRAVPEEQVSVPQTASITPAQKPVPPSMNDLEASAANIAIPSFENVL
jgi:hypothetical protein